MSLAGSWTQRLYNILRPAPHPFTTLFKNSPNTSKRPPGALYRRILAKSIEEDLAGPMNRPGTRRRFVRIESMGRIGLLFYETLVPPSTLSTAKDSYFLTFEGVMGKPHDMCALGLDLSDTVNGRVVYFPPYACTSSLAGQAMHTSLLNRSEPRPQPSLDGFPVLLSADAGYRSSTVHKQKVNNTQQAFWILQLDDFLDEDEEHRVTDLLTSFSSSDLSPMLSLDDSDAEFDPHFSLFVPQAALPSISKSSEQSPHRRSSSSLNGRYYYADSEEDLGDSSLGTIKSVGLFTPPPMGTSAGITLATNDVHRHRESAVDADRLSFLDLSHEDGDISCTEQITNIGFGVKIY
ncbi:unnamed protein product [Cyclocybe aegerita]|uniref:Uncharacterized protein n=1 Tax=Cyclocybe aegerita TaxID=1973307 RepID=A0A8S0WIN0_CYCAE|nr:unnamed protein product [Cyclocybe aegerita]